MRARCFALALALAGCIDPDEPIDPSAEPTAEDESALAVGLPIHGADTYWNYPYGGYMLRVDQRVRIDDTAPYMYWAHHAWLTGAGKMMYMGMQTNALLTNGTRGRMAIFSLWGANGAQTGAAGSWCLDFGGEGTGKSCRIKYNFLSGREYVFSLMHDGDDASGAWWRARIIDQATGAATTIGRIRAPTGSGLIQSTASFSEVWGGTYATCQNITPSQAVFWPPVSWTLFQPGTQTAWDAGSITNACANGRSIQYGGVKVHQLGW